jgi:uncharacterized membrane protein YfcA
VALSPQWIVGLLFLGIGIGMISGMIGIGGGIMVIPALMLLFGFSQQKANGTSLAMILPPIGIFAVMSYHRAGNIDWSVAMLLAAGFAIGAYVGGELVRTGKVPDETLRILFALLLIYVTGRLLFRADRQAHAAIQTVAIAVAFGVTYLVLRLLGRKWSKAPYYPSIYQDRLHRPLDQDYEI